MVKTRERDGLCWWLGEVGAKQRIAQKVFAFGQGESIETVRVMGIVKDRADQLDLI